MAADSSEPLASPTYQASARLLGVASSLFALALATLSALAITDLVQRRFATGLALLLVVVAARWVLASALEEWSDVTAQRLRARWRAALIVHLRAPQREGERARGDLALAVDQAAQEPSLERLRVSAASSLLGVVVIFWAAGWLALVITVALIALAVPFYQRAGRRSERMAKEYQARRALLESRQLEVLHHAVELRALGAVDYGAREIGAISESEHAIALRAIRVALESSLVTEFLGGVSVGLVAMVVGFALLGGRVSLVRALVAVLVTSELFTQIRRFGVEFHRRDDAQHALAALRAPASPASPSDDLLVARALVTAANATPVSLHVRRGDRVLISGPSGVGKSTLLQTLLGWRAPLGGAHERTTRAIAHVSVESALVSGTLRDNLTLGVAIDDATILARLHTLGLDGERFVDLDVELLSDGRGLSDGERVRLVLARALLAEPSLLVLDDVAGVLDADARRLVQSVLDERPDLAVVEATIDAPLLGRVSHRTELA